MKKSIVNFALILTGLILGSISNFLIQMYLAKVLSISDYGVYTSILNTINILTPLIGFGFSSYILKLYGQYGGETKYFISIIIKALILTSLLTFILLEFWILLNDTTTFFIAFLFFIYMLSLSVNAFTRLKYQVEENFFKFSLWQILPNLFRIISILVIFYIFQTSIETIAWAYAIAAIIVILFAANSLRLMKLGKVSLDKGIIVQDVYDKEGLSMKDVFRNSYPYGLSGLLYLVYYQSDVLLISHYLDYTSVGYYGFAVTLVVAVCLIPSIYFQSLHMPKVHRYAMHDLKELKRFYIKHLKFMLMIGTLVTFLFHFFIRSIVTLIFNDKYNGSLDILQILSFYILFKFISLNSDTVMSTENLINYKLKIMGLAAILNIFLNVCLLKTYGIKAAAYITLLTEFFILICFDLKLRSFFKNK